MKIIIINDKNNSQVKKGYRGIFYPFDLTINIYYPNIKNSIDLFLTYFHEILHYISTKYFGKGERIIWFLLDYRKFYLLKHGINPWKRRINR